MNTSIPSPTDQLDESRQVEFESLLHELHVAHLEVVSFSADRLGPGPAPTTQYGLTTGAAGEAGRLIYRFDAEARLIGEGDQPVAVVKVGLLIAFTLPENKEPPAEWAVERMARNATWMVYPYLRENIQTLSARLGYMGVIMPMAVFESDGAPAKSATKDK